MLSSRMFRFSVFVCLFNLLSCGIWATGDLTIHITNSTHQRVQANCVSALESIVLPNTDHVSLFKWIGSPPPEKHFAPHFYTREQKAAAPVPGDLLEVLSLERLKYFMSQKMAVIPDEESFYLLNMQGIPRQKVSKNTDYEKRILEESFKGAVAKEVASTRIHFDGRETVPVFYSIFTPPLTFGEPFEFYPGAPREINFHPWSLSDMLKSLEGDGAKIKRVEIFHTHPVIQIWNETQKKGYFYPLSNPNDLDAPQQLSVEHPGIIFRQTAIAPNGYNFSVEFKNGELLQK